MKAVSGLSVDVLCTGTQGPFPLILHLEGSDRLRSSFLVASASRSVPLAQDRRELFRGLTPTSILLMVEQASWFPFNQALSSVKPV